MRETSRKPLWLMQNKLQGNRRDWRGRQRPCCSTSSKDVGPSPKRTEKNLKTLRGG